MNTRHYIIPILLAVTIAGCGGSAPSVSGSAEIERDYGNLTTRAVGDIAAPMVMNTGGLSVTGIYGASFSLARLNLPPANQMNVKDVVAQTQIAYDLGSTPMIQNMEDFTSYAASSMVTTSGSPTNIAISPLGDRFYTTEADPATGMFQVFVTTIDGQTRTRLTSDLTHKYNIDVSADGARLAVGRMKDGVYQISTMSAAGGAIADITKGGESKYLPRWSPSGAMIVYVTNSGELWRMNADGTAPVRILPGGYFFAADWTSSNEVVAASYSGGYYYVTRWNFAGQGQTLLSTTDAITYISSSPDGSQAAMVRILGGQSDIYTMSTVGVSNPISTRQTYAGSVRSVNWGPYIRQKSFIGSGGALSSGAGFLVAQQGKRVPSYLVFDATTRAGVTVEPSETQPNQVNLICTIKASDALTQIRYSNQVFAPATAVLTSGATASGAVVAFDVESGDVASVIPFVGAVAPEASRGKDVVYKGKFLGIWDAKGKNLAEGGATTVAIDPATGKAVAR